MKDNVCDTELIYTTVFFGIILPWTILNFMVSRSILSLM